MSTIPSIRRWCVVALVASCTSSVAAAVADGPASAPRHEPGQRQRDPATRERLRAWLEQHPEARERLRARLREQRERRGLQRRPGPVERPEP
jgi:hypothetical protein